MESAKQIASKGAIAVIVVLFLASLALYGPTASRIPGPSNSTLPGITLFSTSVTTTILVTAGITQTITHTDIVQVGPRTITTGGSTTWTGAPVVPALLAGVVSSQNVSCSLATSSCSMKISNNGKTSSFDIVGVGCQEEVIASKNSTTTVYDIVQGTLGGKIVGIPAGGLVNLTCSVSMSQLSLESSGSAASGNLIVELLHDLSPSPPGTMAFVSFSGTWN